MTSREIIMVIGMHRSGTSLCASILSRFGVAMTDDNQVNASNPLGHWERHDLVKLHDAVLRHFDRDWYGPHHATSLPPDWWRDPAIAPLRDELAGRLRDLAARHDVVGFKDPRTTLLLPMWREIFAATGFTPRYVACLRSPAEVAASIAARDPFDVAEGLRRWALYCSRMLENLADTPVCLIPYHEWFVRPRVLLDHLAGFLPLGPRPGDPVLRERALPVLAGELRHHRAEALAPLPPFLQTLYAAMLDRPGIGPFGPRARELAAQFLAVSEVARPSPATPMRPLRTGQARRRFLVYARCGNHSLLDTWFDPGRARDWDLVLGYYEISDQRKAALAAGAFGDCRAFIGGASKFSSFLGLLRAGQLDIEGYEAVLFLDDDIMLSGADLDRAFELFATHRLDLAQLSLTEESFSSWPITLRQPGSVLRFTNFVEIMMPIMSARTLARCLDTFDMAVSGWGLDFVWPKRLGYPQDRIAIIDAVSATHSKKVDLLDGRFYRHLATLGVDAVAEKLALLRMFAISDAESEPRVFATIPA